MTQIDVYPGRSSMRARFLQVVTGLLIASCASDALAYNFVHFGGRLNRDGVDTGPTVAAPGGGWAAHDFLWSWNQPVNGKLTWEFTRGALPVAACNAACLTALEALIQPEFDKWMMWIRQDAEKVAAGGVADVEITFVGGLGPAVAGQARPVHNAADPANELSKVFVEVKPTLFANWGVAAAQTRFADIIVHEFGHVLGLGDLYMVNHAPPTLPADQFEGEDFCDHGLPTGALPDPRTKADNVMQATSSVLDNDSIHGAQWLWGTDGPDAIVTGDLATRNASRNANEAANHHGISQTTQTWIYRGSVQSDVAAPKVTLFFRGILAARNVAIVPGPGAAWVPTIFPNRVEFDAPGPYEGNFKFELDCNQRPERFGNARVLAGAVATDFTAVPAGGGRQTFPFDQVYGADCCEEVGGPAVSQWGMVAIVLLLLTGMAIKFGRRRVRWAAG